jgi:hypothetical protein
LSCNCTEPLASLLFAPEVLVHLVTLTCPWAKEQRWMGCCLPGYRVGTKRILWE